MLLLCLLQTQGILDLDVMSLICEARSAPALLYTEVYVGQADAIDVLRC